MHLFGLQEGQQAGDGDDVKIFKTMGTVDDLTFTVEYGENKVYLVYIAHPIPSLPPPSVQKLMCFPEALHIIVTSIQF
jgi:hypothetical protein